MYYRLGQSAYIINSLNILCVMMTGRWAESETLYKESLEQSGDHETTYNNLGKKTAVRSDLESMFVTFSPAASLYGETKRFKESEEMFRKALELNPHYTEAYFNLGQWRYR